MAQFIYNPLVLKTSTHNDYTRRYVHRLPMSNFQNNSSDPLPNPNYKECTKTTQYIDLITQVSQGFVISKMKVSCSILRWEKTTPDFYD